MSRWQQTTLIPRAALTEPVSNPRVTVTLGGRSPFADKGTGAAKPKVPGLGAEKMDASGLAPESVLAEHMLYTFGHHCK